MIEFRPMEGTVGLYMGDSTKQTIQQRYNLDEHNKYPALRSVVGIDTAAENDDCEQH